MSKLTQKSDIVNQNCVETVITGTGEVLVDMSASGRERPWAAHKQENMQLLKVMQLAHECDDLTIKQSRLDDFAHCGEVLCFEQDAQGQRRLKRANFCHVRVCPICNWRRSLKLFAQVSKITDEMLKTQKVRFIFVTFTIKNTKAEFLEDAISAINKGFAAITNKHRTLAAAKRFKTNLLGYMKAIEITYNAVQDTYHPHIHAIFAVRPSYFKTGYLTRKAWRDLWQAVMQLDYSPQVDVRAISGREKAVAEMAKYPVKTADLLTLDLNTAALALLTLYRAMHGRRLVTFGGQFREIARKLRLDDVENGDLIHVDDEAAGFNPVALVLFKYHARVGLYIC